MRSYGSERGIAVVFAIFAVCAFAVLGVGALTTPLALSPPSSTYDAFHYVMRAGDGQFNAPLVIPVNWRTSPAPKGSSPSRLTLGFLENLNVSRDLTSSFSIEAGIAPGVTVCCDGGNGQCAQREGAAIEWAPNSDDSQQLSFDLATEAVPPSPGSPSQGEDMITATRLTAPGATALLGSALAEQSSGPISCRLEVQGVVVAKADAALEQIRRPDTSGAGTQHIVQGSIDLSVRTK